MATCYENWHYDTSTIITSSWSIHPLWKDIDPVHISEHELRQTEMEQ